MLNIFLVDENYFQSQALRYVLEETGQSNIAIFEDELECLQHLDQQPDLIFLAHNLSTFSGHAILRKIKLFNPKIQVVIVSAKEDLQAKADSLKFGAMDYIKKNENLELQVKRVLKNMAVLRQTQLDQQQVSELIKKIFSFLRTRPKNLKTT